WPPSRFARPPLSHTTGRFRLHTSAMECPPARCLPHAMAARILSGRRPSRALGAQRVEQLSTNTYKGTPLPTQDFRPVWSFGNTPSEGPRAKPVQPRFGGGAREFLHSPSLAPVHRTRS